MLYLFNTTIMPNEGVFECKKITPEIAVAIVKRAVTGHNNDSEGNPLENWGNRITSAIGHQGAADAFNALVPRLDCQVNRIPAVMQRRDRAICLKVIGRIAEGQILDIEALNEIGYELYLVTMIADSADQMAVELNATVIYEQD